jgi:hypothetical protein
MDCRTYHRRLEDYLEGGMDFPARFGMERHARQCYACEKHVTEALHLRQRTRELARVGAPADFETSLLAKIREEKARHRFWKLESFWVYGFDRLSWRTAGAAATAVVLIAGAVTLSRFGVRYFETEFRQSPDRTHLEQRYPGEGGDPASVPSRLGTPGWGDPGNSGGALNVGASGYFGRDAWAIPYSEPGDSDYWEFLVPVSGDRQLIMRLPRTIRMRYDQPSQEYFIRNVSH